MGNQQTRISGLDWTKKMRNIAKATILGNLTSDPFYDPAKKLCKMTVAVNRNFTSNGEKKTEADFFKVVAWEKLGELCSQLLHKSSFVYFVGRLHNFEYNGGTQTEIVLDDMINLRGSEQLPVEDIDPDANTE